MELTLKFDQNTSISIKDLMHHYRVNTTADIISKALAVLKIVAHVDKTQGEIVARKGLDETQIIVR
jgi:hypothetical protein